MKKNKMMRLAAIVLMLTLLTTCAISGTFAKYTASATGSDTARVAKWSFKVKDTDIAGATNTFTFDLFNTVYDTNNDPADNNKANDTDVSDATDTTAIIAPGTWGYFDIELNNASEVTAAYTIDFTELTTSGIPLHFKKAVVTQGAEVAYPTTGSWGDLESINVAETQLAINGSTVIRVYWEWVFDGNTDTDTNLGVNAVSSAQNITIQAEINIEQVD